MTAGAETARARGRRTSPIILVTGAVLVAAMAASVLIGARSTPPAETIAALVAGPGGEVGEDLSNLVWRLRVPRTVLAVLAGASLAVAGALAQVWTRNPMADPGIIGITSGAGLAVAVAAAAGLTAPAHAALLSLAGAALVATLVLAVARRAEDPLTVLLVGVATAFALTAVTTVLALHQRSVLDGIRQWTVGSTVGRGGTDLVIAAAGLSVGLVLAAVAARPMDLLSMGADTATGLGGDPAAARTMTAAAVVVLAGCATAATGPIAFVGFAAPHLVRRFTGPALTRMLVPVALTGAAMTVLADVLGRMIARPGEVEVSVVLAVLGAPLLVAAVARPRLPARRRQATS